MDYIKQNIIELQAQLPAWVKLVAVSKTHPIEAIKAAYDAGQLDFGENKVQEMCNKHEQLSNPNIRWHLIGHLQTNKVKYIAEFVEMIHSVDSLRLLEEIDKQAKKHNRIIDCLLQFHIATEETKFGLDLEEAEQILRSENYKNLQNVRICGVMGMASYSDDIKLVRNEFKTLNSIFLAFKENYFASCPHFKEISMGMSGDWKIAIEEGSTIIRVGSIIFGQRNYNLK
ncbi:MAG: YggS family pyridoxal phosphate-dependent enzyme [Bacteroidales bacterium]|nr:YggS family pyridoxal phosphate-dependent enzyme [Bacteroidales bacterium]